MPFVDDLETEMDCHWTMNPSHPPRHSAAEIGLRLAASWRWSFLHYLYLFLSCIDASTCPLQVYISSYVLYISKIKSCDFRILFLKQVHPDSRRTSTTSHHDRPIRVRVQLECVKVVSPAIRQGAPKKSEGLKSYCRKTEVKGIHALCVL